jgi:hypothetical protein
VRASDGYVLLFNGRDLDRWEGNEQVWKVENGLLTGTSDGKIASALVLAGREYGDFELLFELRVKKGAAVVLMRGPSEGPLGAELKVYPPSVRWSIYGSPDGTVVSIVKPDEWGTYRIASNGKRFDGSHNGVTFPISMGVTHLAPRGKLSLVLPAGVPSEVEFRNIRIKE